MTIVSVRSWDEASYIYDELKNLGYHIQYPPLRFYNALNDFGEVYFNIRKPLVFYCDQPPYGKTIYPFTYFYETILPTWKTKRFIRQSQVARDYIHEILIQIIGGCDESDRNNKASGC